MNNDIIELIEYCKLEIVPLKKNDNIDITNIIIATFCILDCSIYNILRFFFYTIIFFE